MAMESGETNSQDQSSSSKDQSTEWIISIEKKLGSLGARPLDLSIFKVPCKLREVNEAAYCPQIVSIGPFHASSAKEDDDWQRNMISLLQQKQGKKRDNLIGMQENKWWYMLFFLQRTSNSKQALHDLGVAIKARDKDVRLSYAEGIKFGSDELAEMMLLDGCFILELFIRSWFKKSPNEHDFLSWFKHSPFEGDPIFYTSWMLPALRQDLALLENQIPFFILQTLYDIFMKERKPHENTSCQKIEIPSITLLALSFFRPDLELNQLKPELWKAEGEKFIEKCRAQDGKPCQHLLDLLHNFYLPTVCKAHPAPAPAPADPAPAKCKELNLGFREGATKLIEAGIEFKKVVEDNFLDVEFDDKTGDINIPQMSIDETTESLLRNLIAFEQCSPKGKHYVSSYVILMKSLLRSSTDVEYLLQKKEVITDNLGGNENVLNFFKNISMGMGVVREDFCFGQLCKDVNKYRQQYSTGCIVTEL